MGLSPVKALLVQILKLGKETSRTLVYMIDDQKLQSIYLEAFRETGGKLLPWHGLVDQEIYVQVSQSYYNRVEGKDANVRDFYRVFEVSGVAHCGGGNGLIPGTPSQSWSARLNEVLLQIICHLQLQMASNGEIFVQTRLSSHILVVIIRRSPSNATPLTLEGTRSFNWQVRSSVFCGA
ncbi:hypothetical protein PENARI_c020G07282 [Penicillium arizonense]|uniref:Carboxylic ester hydrolase n=1 Tax=Penicillium arizonense TaxID=1835702 RepID=A0A1F5L8L5_PENAI|nr:hypothetical protein PENARI_c020G07282 [Penicillium arizonense]OGE49563.1 hypothetical protein PENARI_c020G07282 [Penicillium arizonense]